MKNHTIRVIFSAACASLMILGCSEADPAAPEQTEFVAHATDFAGLTAWTETVPARVGPDPASAVGGAHGADDTTLRRWMWIKQPGATRSVSGQFPNGTILAKQTRRGDTVLMTLAMVKRGGSFNTAGKGWEWFVLNTDGSIDTRGGAEVMGGACNACHAGALDNVFTR